MLGKEEKAELKVEFFGELNKKMDKIRNVHGGRVNWLNYPLRYKHFYARVIIEDDAYGFVIDMQHKNEGIRQLLLEQWGELKKALENQMEKTVTFNDKHIMFTGIPALRLTLHWDEKSWMNKENWQEIQEELKKTLVNFDIFWHEFGAIFQTLFK